MPVRFIIDSRENFILFGKIVAQTLREHDPNRQWIISLQGDTNGGKSLIPLAADLQLNPHRYSSEGITDHFVHEMAAHHHPEYYQGIYDEDEFAKIGAPQPHEQKIYFNDGLAQIKFHEGEYRAPWEAMLATMPETKLVYLSNIWNWAQLRTRSNAAQGKKILIDMRMAILVAEDEGFVRLVNYNTGDNTLDKKIKSAYDAAIKANQPIPPVPASKRRRRSPPKNEQQ